MTTEVKSLIKQVNNLNSEDKSAFFSMVDKIRFSDDVELTSDFKTELDRRIEAEDNGTMTMHPWPDIRKKLLS